MGLIRADARQIPLVAECVDCCVTSPPYFGLRDYGNPSQIGLEETPDAYVANIVAVMREVRRVLKPQGTAWVNLGDSYAAQRGGTHQPAETLAGGVGGRTGSGERVNRDRHDGYNPTRNAHAIGLKHKDLIGIPWRVAFALQADGWYLRSDIIWHKPNPMPESVTDRPTKAHEYLFLLAKSERYYYDALAIAESTAHVGLTWEERKQRGEAGRLGIAHGGCSNIGGSDGVRNKRTVWSIPTKPFAGAHFATMPEALVEPCILAGCPVGGLVLDPFIGSGTVGVVAERTGRRWVGTDLSYHDIATKRTAQRGLALEIA